jgi:hypothetical protein
MLAGISGVGSVFSNVSISCYGTKKPPVTSGGFEQGMK